VPSIWSAIRQPNPVLRGQTQFNELPHRHGGDDMVGIGKSLYQGKFLVGKSDGEAACPGHVEFLLEVASVFMADREVAKAHRVKIWIP